MHLGDFITTGEREAGTKLEATGGALHRFGLEDDATAALLLELIKADALPISRSPTFPITIGNLTRSDPKKRSPYLITSTAASAKFMRRRAGWRRC
jgi:hypothetical protein